MLGAMSVQDTSHIPAGLPIAELHCHLEGTLRPGLMRMLAARHGADLSRLPVDGETYLWRDFNEFLGVYDAVSAVVRTQQDYYDLVSDYLETEAARGLIYLEFFISAEHPMRHGLTYPAFLDALAQAIDDAQAKWGTVCRLVLTAVRHYGPEASEASARLAAQHPHRLVTGFGLAGDEAHAHKADFARAFAMAKDAGLRLTAHAGEVTGPHSVRDALDHLQVERIGHGVRSIEDPALVDRLVAEGIVLEVCPGSNVALGFYPDLASHPVRALIDRGVAVTLSSDDPPFFDTNVRREYESVAAVHGLGPQALLACTRTALRGSFCDAATRDALLARVDAWEREKLTAS